MGKKPLKAQSEELAISSIQVNDYNPNEMSPKAYRKLVEEIQANGFLSGVLVYREGDISSSWTASTASWPVVRPD